MATSIKNFFTSLFTDGQQFIIMGVVMVSAIIVLIGLLKPFTFDKIPFKPLRKVALALTNVGLSFAATAICFWIYSIPFMYYLYGAGCVTLATIITYWLYENTCLRNLIHFIGSHTLGKIIPVFFNNKNDVKKLKEELKNVGNELAKSTKKTLTDKSDNELKNL